MIRGYVSPVAAKDVERLQSLFSATAGVRVS
jgi:hypothetical protein